MLSHLCFAGSCIFEPEAALAPGPEACWEGPDAAFGCPWLPITPFPPDQSPTRWPEALGGLHPPLPQVCSLRFRAGVEVEGGGLPSGFCC